jgi:hypothetical protein
LIYRNAIVLLECVRDVALVPPLYVFRARRPGSLAPTQSSHAPATVRSLVANGHPLPTISPAALAAAAERRDNSASVDIAVSVYGKKDLERQMKRGLVLAEDSPEGRVMEALVRLGYAEKGRATRAERR